MGAPKAVEDRVFTSTAVQGKIVSSETLGAMESVNIVNLNQVIGTTTNTRISF